MSVFPLQHAVKQLENLLNRALEYDPGTRLALSEITGTSLGIEVTFPPAAITLSIASDGSIALSTDDAATDVQLRGNLIALAVLLSQANNTLSFAKTGVSITGNQDVLLKVSAILANLDIDWEQALAAVIGDTPAHMASQAVRNTHTVITDGAKRSQSGIGDYIREESGLTVSYTEAERWFDDVTVITASAERLEARVNLLKSRTNQSLLDGKNR